MVKRCAYLVMKDPGDFVTDYHLSFDAMNELGWQVDCVPWSDTLVDWDQFDAVYICTPWDYPDDPELFLKVLEAIEASSAKLINPLSLARWTLTKTYLKDLAERGGSVVPSLWFDRFDTNQVEGWFDRLNTDRVVIKPQIGASAQGQVVLRQPVNAEQLAEVEKVYGGGQHPFFVQPYLKNVQREGEYSLFFFGGAYSHAILKTPKAGDFRSQEEYGSEIKSVTPTKNQIDAAEKLLALVEPRPTYARVDLVRDNDDDNHYLLMELELIEPSLYLRTDPHSAGRFARAFDKAVSSGIEENEKKK